MKTSEFEMIKTNTRMNLTLGTFPIYTRKLPSQDAIESQIETSVQA